MKEITVIGCCVCRDLFEADTENFSFQTDIRFSSPISMLSAPAEGVHADFDCFPNDVPVVGGKWYKKNLINDINKTAFTALEARHGEYLVLDFAEARIALAKITFPNEQSLLVTNSVSFRAHYTANLKQNILKDTKLTFISPLEYDDAFWQTTIEAFAAHIKTLFAEEKIILLKNRQAEFYVDANGLLHPYSSDSHFNSIMVTQLLLEKLEGYFLACCPNCKTVEIPPYAIGTQKHKWGNHPLHFTQTLYEYLLACVKAITLEENTAKLGELYVQYGERFKAEYDEAKRKTAIASAKGSAQIGVAELLSEYEEYNALGKKQKAMLLFALDKKNFMRDFKVLIKGKGA